MVTETSMPKQHLANHLILLVGENPLPNAVAASCMVVPDGQITLLHTGATEEIANNLRLWIENNACCARVNYRKIDESDPNSIYQVTQTILKRNPEDVVGLNYTGGTKTMAVHAFRAVDEWTEEYHATGIFSYLDARSLEMVISRSESGYIVQTERVKVGRSIRIQLDQMIALRGWQLLSTFEDPIFPHTAAALMRLALDDKTWRQWNETRKAFLSAFRDPGPNKGGKFLPENELSGRLMFEKADTFPEPLRQALKEDGLDLESCTVHQAAEKAHGSSLPRVKTPHQDVLKFFDSFWLESYCLSQMQAFVERGELDSAMRNVVVKDPQFEIDVTATRGYQLFVMSCTTIDQPDKGEKATLKHKLFEAYVRSRQLGGDEARVMLVTLSNFPAVVEAEMSQFMGGGGLVGERHVKVFGRQHLEKLGEHIREWILEQSN